LQVPAGELAGTTGETGGTGIIVDETIAVVVEPIANLGGAGVDGWVIRRAVVAAEEPRREISRGAR
jgi:hypothetical protein